MRRSLLATLVFAACATTPAPVPPPTPAAPIVPEAHGFTVEEEAALLRLEDRREFDGQVAATWLGNPNPLHRERIALALGRIGAATFIDANGNGEKDPGEKQAGVDQLASLVTDPSADVRRTTAFALGLTKDPAAIESLFALAHDQDNADVAAEAVEALSKIADSVPLNRYAELAAPAERKSVRARAIRYLFRFKTDEASAIARNNLDTPDADVRREAVYALSRRAWAPARPSLELLVGDPDALIRSYAARALGAITSPESLVVLTEALRDQQPWVRTNAAVAIGRIAAKDPNALRTSSMAENAVHLMSLTEDADPGTRASAIDPLGYYARINEGARKRLLDIASSGSRWERELAIGAVARQFGDDAGSPLTALLASATNWGKVRVLEASDAMKVNGTAIRRKLAGDADPMVRSNAIAAIPTAEADRQIDLIRSALDDPDVIVRSNAIDKYDDVKSESQAKKIGTLSAAEQRGRGDRDNDARLSAIRALANIDRPEREGLLRSLLTDRDPVVRRVASDLIVEKLKKNRPQYTPLPIDRPLTDYAAIVEWSRQPHTATIHMTRGNIELGLLSRLAPMTTWNFAQLASHRTFDNTSFMRVVPNFVVQGGDPRNDMNGGPGYAIRDEINLQKYTRGAVGMALSGPDTGGSQFFLTHSPQPHLDGGYTIFGRVVDGMPGVVDQTERGDKVERIGIDERHP